jgi:hypothetical protein
MTSRLTNKKIPSVMKTILSDNFETKLGVVTCYLQSDSMVDPVAPGILKLSSAGYSIYCQNFDLKKISSDQPAQFESGKGWRWFIEKSNDIEEQLMLFCKLMNPSDNVQWDNASGENLNAIEISNHNHLLQIGTEDEFMMEYRAEAGDWMPEQYKRIDINNNLWKGSEFGMKVTIPILKKGEKIYIHFLVAAASFDSAATRESASSGTSLAVEKSKTELDDQCGEAFSIDH